MWELHDPKPVKLIIGILAANETALAAAVKAISKSFGTIDLTSDVWPFTQTDYYKDELGPNALRQFVSIEKLVDPGKLAQIKHDTNSLEQQLAGSLKLSLPRPVNLDPGFIEPSKLILASTKNFSHRIYIGNKMFAEVTLMYEKGAWRHFEFTFPDYRQSCYQDFLSKARTRLLEQLKSDAK
ncbi:MAG: DUF4416 family protein [Planctomycetes bacterium]|nr:DUF4416 family protein [Planctomycetota bacterium]